MLGPYFHTEPGIRICVPRKTLNSAARIAWGVRSRVCSFEAASQQASKQASKRESHSSAKERKKERDSVAILVQAVSAQAPSPPLREELQPGPSAERESPPPAIVLKVTIADLRDLSFQVLTRDLGVFVSGRWLCALVSGVCCEQRDLPAAAPSPQELRWEGACHVYMIVTVATRA